MEHQGEIWYYNSIIWWITHFFSSQSTSTLWCLLRNTLNLWFLCSHLYADLYYCRNDTIFYMSCPGEGLILYKRWRMNVKLRYFYLHLYCCWDFLKGIRWCVVRGDAVGWGYKPEGRGFESRWYNWNFSLTSSFRSHYGPGVDSNSNRNEYQEYFLGVKAVGAYGWQPYHLRV